MTTTTKLAAKLVTRLIEHFIEPFLARVPVPVLLGPSSLISSNSNLGQSITDLLDGIVFATPKRRTPFKRLWQHRYGNDNWKGAGTKLYKPKRNITTCDECGSFHEYHTICRNCYNKVKEESKDIIEKIRNAWGKGVIDKEVQVLYKGETTSNNLKRIVEIDKPRPLWFAPNLSQKTARPIREITGPASETIITEIKIKE